MKKTGSWAVAISAVLTFLFTYFFFISTSIADNPMVTPQDAISRAKSAWAAIYQKASWREAYSRENTVKFEPYTAGLINGVWIVKGTIPSGYRGEVLESTIRQSDGSVSVIIVKVNNHTTR